MVGIVKFLDDFIDIMGVVEFVFGFCNSIINIIIIDNNILEFEKIFRVEFFNIEGGGMFFKLIFF